MLYVAAATAAKLLQSCPTLCDPTDGSPPGSPVPGILQARTLEWVAISFSNAGKWKVKVKSLSHARLVTTPWTAAYQDPLPMGFSRQEYWSGVPLPSPKCYMLVTSDSLWPHGLQPARLLCPWDSPGKNTGVGCHALLQRIFPTQGSKLGPFHCRQVLYSLTHQQVNVIWIGANLSCSFWKFLEFFFQYFQSTTDSTDAESADTKG